MARALLGYVDTVGADRRLLQMEVVRLRRRVAELESELDEARLALLAADARNDDARATVQLSDEMADRMADDAADAPAPALA